MANCPNCGALIKYGQSYCNVHDGLTGWEAKMKKPIYKEVYVGKESDGVRFFKEKPVWFSRFKTFEQNENYLGRTTFVDGFESMKESQICKVGLIIWGPEDKDGTD